MTDSKTRKVAKNLKKILNRQDPKTQFTAEYEDSNEVLNYLDVSILNNENGKYDFKVHRKDAITNIQIKPDSCHDNKRRLQKLFAQAICKSYLLKQKLFAPVSISTKKSERKLLKKPIALFHLNLFEPSNRYSPAATNQRCQRIVNQEFIPFLPDVDLDTQEKRKNRFDQEIENTKKQSSKATRKMTQ